MLDDIVADDIAQSIRVPIPATQDRLLPPWTGIASRLRAHPAGLALLFAEQTFQKKACVPRNTFLPEQRTYPLLHLTKRRRPQRKRLFNRRCLRPRSSNHGCPWIQKSPQKATVMLVHFDNMPQKEDARMADLASDPHPKGDTPKDTGGPPYQGSTCVYRKLKSERSDGEAPRGLGVNESFRPDESDEKSAHPCAETDVF